VAKADVPTRHVLGAVEEHVAALALEDLTGQASLAPGHRHVALRDAVLLARLTCEQAVHRLVRREPHHGLGLLGPAARERALLESVAVHDGEACVLGEPAVLGVGVQEGHGTAGLTELVREREPEPFGGEDQDRVAVRRPHTEEPRHQTREPALHHDGDADGEEHERAQLDAARDAVGLHVVRGQ
jgi:hypothetical protein